MIFSSIVGHADTTKFLDRLLNEKRVPHLLVFSGKSGIGKKEVATQFAKNWIGSTSLVTPDLHIYTPEGKLGLHTVQSIKNMTEKLSFKPYQGRGVAIIIDDAERMLAASANALLKTIEEPPPNTLIIMVTSSINELIPTIRSRCQLIRFHPLKDEEVSKILQNKFGNDEKISNSVAKMARGSISRALKQLYILPEMEKLKDILQSREGNVVSQIFDFSQKTQKLLEERKKALEEEFSKQKEESFQEVDGELQTKWLQEVDYLLEDFYFLMRDMILEKGADPSLLVKVEKALSFSKLQIKRSTPLLQSIENLLLHFHEVLQK